MKTKAAVVYETGKPIEIEELDLEPVDAGPLLAARYVEPANMLLVHLAYRQGLGTSMAFGLLRR